MSPNWRTGQGDRWRYATRACAKHSAWFVRRADIVEPSGDAIRIQLESVVNEAVFLKLTQERLHFLYLLRREASHINDIMLPIG